MADLLIAPYLPVSVETSIGEWELLPFRDALPPATPRELRTPVERLIEAYRLSSGGGAVLGVVVFPAGAYPGAPFARAEMSGLGRALLVGAIAGNPFMAVPEVRQDANAGHAAASAENALLYGHPLGGGSSYVISTGTIVQRMDFRTAVEDGALPKVQPPTDLPTPLFGQFDDEIAAACLAVLGAGDTASRRLHRALDWYSLCFSNATAVTAAARVVAFRCALEALTGVGDESKKLVRAVGQMLGEAATPAETREPYWARGPVALTPEEWWVTRLCELRNSIVHGDDVPAELWSHEGHPQMDHAHDQLLRCLRHYVATSVRDDALALPQSERVWLRVADELRAKLSGQGSGDADLDG